MIQPFKEFEIVRLRPEDRDPRTGTTRLWLMCRDKIVEMPEIDISGLDPASGYMWQSLVAGWGIVTVPAMMSEGDDPYFMTECFEIGGHDVTLQQASTTQAEAHANHYAKVEQITDDCQRLQAHQRRGHLFELKFPFDPEMDEWMEEHTPSASLKDFGVFGQRIFVPDADEAFAWKMRWV